MRNLILGVQSHLDRKGLGERYSKKFGHAQPHLSLLTLGPV